MKIFNRSFPQINRENATKKKLGLLMSKGSFTPRTITVRIPNTITILASTPTSNNFLFIINASCYYVIYCFKCTRSLNLVKFWLAINVFIVHHLESIVQRVNIGLLFCYHYSCNVDFPIFIELKWLLKLLLRVTVIFIILAWTDTLQKFLNLNCVISGLYTVWKCVHIYLCACAYAYDKCIVM